MMSSVPAPASAAPLISPFAPKLAHSEAPPIRDDPVPERSKQPSLISPFMPVRSEPGLPSPSANRSDGNANAPVSSNENGGQLGPAKRAEEPVPSDAPRLYVVRSAPSECLQATIAGLIFKTHSSSYWNSVVCVTAPYAFLDALLAGLNMHRLRNAVQGECAG
jgi:hypothetical protein